MAIISVGYDGPVTEAQWAQMAPLVGSSRYGVLGLDHWATSVKVGTDRTVTVAPGSGWGHGVFDTSNTPVDVQLPTISSGSRWDLICAKRDWSGTGGTTTITYLQGTSSKTLVGLTPNPGVLDYQPIALARVTAGSTNVQEIVDLRCFGGAGGLFINDTLALQYLSGIDYGIGLGVKLRGGPLYIFEPGADGNTLAWKPYYINAKAISYGSGFKNEPANSGQISRIDLVRLDIPDPGFPYHVHVDAVVEAVGGGPGTRWDVIATFKGGWMTAARGDVQAPWFTIGCTSTGTPAVGPGYVELFAWRQFGNGNFGLSNYNRFFSATVIPA